MSNEIEVDEDLLLVDVAHPAVLHDIIECFLDISALGVFENLDVFLYKVHFHQVFFDGLNLISGSLHVIGSLKLILLSQLRVV